MNKMQLRSKGENLMVRYTAMQFKLVGLDSCLLLRNKSNFTSVLEIHKTKTDKMKISLTLAALTLIIATSHGQSIKRTNCKTADVNIQPYPTEIPENEVVVSLGALYMDREVKELAELTEKEMRKLKKAARSFKTCTAYVDFDRVMIDKDLNPTLTENYLSYVVVSEQEE